MNYADMALGTWYPHGGMFRIVDGMFELAKSLDVKFKFSSPVSSLEMNSTKLKGLHSDESFYPYDYVVAGADYHHVEQELLPARVRKYSSSYWEKRVLAPSCLIFYIGLNIKLKKLLHHNLFFVEDFSQHAREIYEDLTWPSSPQFYVSCPSKTDSSVAPSGCENLMILMPAAPGLTDNGAIREKYFDMIIDRLEQITGEIIKDHIVYKRSYAHNDFTADYNAFKGNAYGLANTLLQTANFKPTITNKKIPNLFYTGQLTVPGPGVPPAIISGQIAARELIKRHSNKT
jgi:phytoene desaturase